MWYTASMESISIILAFPIADSSSLKKELVPFFADGSSDYLTQFQRDGQLFLGKRLSSPVDFETLERSAQNILSLIERLFPPETITIDSLMIFTDQTDGNG